MFFIFMCSILRRTRIYKLIRWEQIFHDRTYLCNECFKLIVYIYVDLILKYLCKSKAEFFSKKNIAFLHPSCKKENEKKLMFKTLCYVYFSEYFIYG